MIAEQHVFTGGRAHVFDTVPHIYDNKFQFFYDKTGVTRDMKLWVCPMLAWWHSYKMACYLIYLKFKSITEHVFKALYPEGTWYPHPHYLSAVVFQMTIARLAYKQVETQLRDALLEFERNPHIDSGDLKNREKCCCLQCIGNSKAKIKHLAVLKNLQSFCEFFIPIVSSTPH